MGNAYATAPLTAFRCICEKSAGCRAERTAVRGDYSAVMLTRKNDAQMDFDFAKVVEASKDNPVFYVQYAHVPHFVGDLVLRGVLAKIQD